jgi:hypothetical protein
MEGGVVEAEDEAIRDLCGAGFGLFHGLLGPS